MSNNKPLPPENLFSPCDLSKAGFDTTDGIEELTEIPGQQRAHEALQFGVDIQQHGYNLFVMGPSGTGKHTLVRQYLEKISADTQAPSDWCYVNNFEQPHRPSAIELPAGRGSIFRDDIGKLVDDLHRAIPLVFESDEYRTRIEDINNEVQQKRDEALNELSEETRSHEVELKHTPRGFTFLPLKNGKVVTPGEYEHYPEDQKKQIEEIVAVLQEKLELIFREHQRWQRQAKEKERQLNRELASTAVDTLVHDVKLNYKDLPRILEFLDSMQQDVIAHAAEFIRQDTQQDTAADDVGILSYRYQINLLIDNSQLNGKPIIYEDAPTYNSLIGRIEHIAQMGTLITDYTLIKPGALHSANGGFLILDIIKVLTEPFLWVALKRALSSREIKILSLAHLMSLVSTVALEPEPIPLDLKVILVGDRTLFYLLLEYDPEFQELFKVAADFEDFIERNDDNQYLYCRIIATIARREKLKPFERAAVGRIIEYSSRLAADSAKLSNHLLNVSDLMREADYRATKGGHAHVDATDIQNAIDANIKRADRIRERSQEEIRAGTTLLDISGEKIGQVNGLSIIDLKNFVFSQPFRITATARLGQGAVIDIEREVELGGPIHSKGVLILSSFLGQRYAAEQLLSLEASLVFEQSYGMVEGDSASMAELCALLSVLADTPIKQSLAITGSVNQLGEAQTIGGVNEKIEGFFDVCQQNGLTGQQGVIIPHTNQKHLMLRTEVVDAAASGKFHIYTVKNVDQAIELLTGVEAGVLDKEGNYPEGSVNQRVSARLENFAKIRQEHAETEKAEKS